MTDDLLHALGRKQRADLEREGPSLVEPFDERERADILDAVFDRGDETATATAPNSEPGKVVQLGARRRAPLIASVLAVAAAATLVWWAWPERGPEHSPIARVPEYAITELEGGIAEQRSDDTDALDDPMPELELRSDSVIKVVLTPAEPGTSPVVVALLARSEAGDTKFVSPVEAELPEGGAVRIHGPLSELVTLEPGSWTVTLFVAPPEQLPRDASDTSDDARWRSVSFRVIMLADE